MRTSFLFVLSIVCAACGGAPARSHIDVHLSQCAGPTSVRAPCVIDQLAAAARAQQDQVALACVTQKQDAMQPLLGVLSAHWGESSTDVAMRDEVDRRLGVLELEAEHCQGFDLDPTHVEVARD